MRKKYSDSKRKEREASMEESEVINKSWVLERELVGHNLHSLLKD
jgi:hypothetical protein